LVICTGAPIAFRAGDQVVETVLTLADVATVHVISAVHDVWMFTLQVVR
jgi:hypothetical protein